MKKLFLPPSLLVPIRCHVIVLLLTTHSHYIVTFLLCCLISTAHSQQIVVQAGEFTHGLGTLDNYPNHVPISSFQIGIQAESRWTRGSGATVGIPNPLPIEITKAVDGFSNKINTNIAQGKAFPLMQFLWLMPNSKGDLTVVHKVELEGAFITEVMNSSAEGCTSNCAVIAESYKMVYKNIKRTVYKRESNGDYSQVNVWMWDIPSGISN